MNRNTFPIFAMQTRLRKGVRWVSTPRAPLENAWGGIWSTFRRVGVILAIQTTNSFWLFCNSSRFHRILRAVEQVGSGLNLFEPRYKWLAHRATAASWCGRVCSSRHTSFSRATADFYLFCTADSFFVFFACCSFLSFFFEGGGRMSRRVKSSWCTRAVHSCNETTHAASCRLCISTCTFFLRIPHHLPFVLSIETMGIILHTAQQNPKACAIVIDVLSAEGSQHFTFIYCTSVPQRGGIAWLTEMQQ